MGKVVWMMPSPEGNGNGWAFRRQQAGPQGSGVMAEPVPLGCRGSSCVPHPQTHVRH